MAGPTGAATTAAGYAVTSPEFSTLLLPSTSTTSARFSLIPRSPQAQATTLKTAGTKAIRPAAHPAGGRGSRHARLLADAIAQPLRPRPSRPLPLRRAILEERSEVL